MTEPKIKQVSAKYVRNVYQWLGFIPECLLPTVRGYELSVAELLLALKQLKIPPNTAIRTAKTERSFPAISLLGCTVYAHQLRQCLKELGPLNPTVFVTLRPASPGAGGCKLMVVGRLSPWSEQKRRGVSSSYFFLAQKGEKAASLELQIKNWTTPMLHTFLLTPPFNRSISLSLL